MSEFLIEASDQDFETVVIERSKQTPVVVDFWAPWCGPCRAMSPVVEEYANDNAGKIKVCKLNTDQNIKTAQRFRIMSIPTIIVFKDGKQVDQFSGAMAKEQLAGKLARHIG
jgi:thioredoxin